MNNILQIKPLDASNWRLAHGVEQACFGDHCYPDFFFRQAIDAWPTGLVGAFVDDELIGYVLCTPGQELDTGWILSVAVLASQRGVGAGKALMQHCLQQGYRQLKLTVAPDNPALGLYQKLGFSEITLEQDYFGPGEHRLLMCWHGA